MVAIGSNIYFIADDGVNGQELWFSDGTNAGTLMLKDIATGSSGGLPENGNPSGFVPAGSNVFFTASTPPTGRELYVTDGTPPARSRQEYRPGRRRRATHRFTGLISYNNQVFFGAQDTATNGIELWVSDGTDAGTLMLKNITTSRRRELQPDGFRACQRQVLFPRQAQAPSRKSMSATARRRTRCRSPPACRASARCRGRQQRVLQRTGAGGQELYVTNGGAATLIDIVPGVNGSNAGVIPVAFGTGVLFSAQDSASIGLELWFSDGAGRFRDGDAEEYQHQPERLLEPCRTSSWSAARPISSPTTARTGGVVGDRRHLRGDVVGEEYRPGLDGRVDLPAEGRQQHPFAVPRRRRRQRSQELWITDGTEAGTFRATDVVSTSRTASPATPALA